jgi:hypothetical protein
LDRCTRLDVLAGGIIFDWVYEVLKFAAEPSESRSQSPQIETVFGTQ